MSVILLCVYRFVRLLGSGHQAIAVENLALRLQLAAATATGVCARCWSAAGAQPARNGCTFAAAIAGRFPEIASRLPKARTLTMSEQYEMPVFDDMAFAQAFFYFRNRKRLLEQRKLLKSAFQRAE